MSPRYLSYLFQIAVAYHPNEQNNFVENIGKGIANLETHQPVVPAEVCRTLLLRLSASASIEDCVKWATWYFGEYPNIGVELILLYQAVPAIVDLARNISGITHCVIPVQGPRYQAWRAADQRRAFAAHSMIGTIIDKPTKRPLTNRRYVHLSARRNLPALSRRLNQC